MGFKVDLSMLFFMVCYIYCISGCFIFNVMNDKVNDNLISILLFLFICLLIIYIFCVRFFDKVF